MIKVEKDHIDGDSINLTISSMPLYGIERVLGESDEIPNIGEEIPFKLFDDDGELYYSGILTDDDECENQTAALRWGESYAGCTRIEVFRNGEWDQEIS